MISLNKRPNAVAYAVLLATGLCANDAFAYGSLGRTVDQTCAGNQLKTEFQPQMENNCSGCHSNGSNGPGAGRSAYEGGNGAMIAFFCPDAVTPEPPPVTTTTPEPPPVTTTTPEPPPAPTTCTDADGDGFNAQGGACGQMDSDDSNAAIHPGATENCTDGIDNNSNNLIDAQDPNAVGCPVNRTDADGDGFAVEGAAFGPVDCDDGSPEVHPGATEICDDGFDNNCDGNADAVDTACQAMTQGDDEMLKKRQDEAKRRHRGQHRDDDHSYGKRIRHGWPGSENGDSMPVMGTVGASAMEDDDEEEDEHSMRSKRSWGASRDSD